MATITDSDILNPFGANQTRTFPGAFTTADVLELTLSTGANIPAATWAIATAPGSGTATLTPTTGNSTVVTYTPAGAGTVTFIVSVTFFGNTRTLTYTITTTAAGTGTGPDHIVSVNHSFASSPIPGEPDTESISFTISTGTGSGQSSGTARRLAAGDVVRFIRGTVSPSSTGILIGGFQTGSWDTTTNGFLTAANPSIDRTWSTGQTAGTTDTIIINPNVGTLTDNVFFVQTPNDPDTTVEFDETITFASGTSFTQTITEVAPNTNSAITRYRIRSTADDAVRGFRTGPGTITVSDANGFPFNGVPRTYYVTARVETADGGTGSEVNLGTFTATRGVAPGDNAPDLTGVTAYGAAIFDNAGTLVSYFQDDTFVPREIYRGTHTISTSTHTDIALGLTGVTDTNAFAVIRSNVGTTGDTNERSVSLPSTFVNGTTLRIGRSTSFQGTSVSVSVIQITGATIGQTANYGTQILNQSGDIVIDGLASYFAVREIVNLAAANVTRTASTTDSQYATIQLTQGRYPGNAGLPVPAINNSSGQTVLIPPVVASTRYSDNSYRFISCIIPAGASFSDFNVAILTERGTSEPQYYGGTASTHGMATYASNGTTETWRSDWRQAIGNNVIDANQFTTGTNQNGSYDVETGRDGVTQPLSAGQTMTEFEGITYSTGQTVSITGLNEMDPSNSYVLGGSTVSGRVRFYRTEVFEDGVSQGTFGGGTHIPGISITGNTTAAITMYRVNAGDAPPTSADNGARQPTSYHPHGSFVIVRIT